PFQNLELPVEGVPPPTKGPSFPRHVHDHVSGISLSELLSKISGFGSGSGLLSDWIISRADRTARWVSLQPAVSRPEQAVARTDWRKRLSRVGIFASRSWHVSTWPNNFSSLSTIRRCSAAGGSSICSAITTRSEV